MSHVGVYRWDTLERLVGLVQVLYRYSQPLVSRMYPSSTAPQEALQMRSPRRAFPVLIERSSADSLLTIHSFDIILHRVVKFSPSTRLNGPR